MSLATPVLGIQADDGGDLASQACQTGQDGLEEFTHPTGRVAVTEEDCRGRQYSLGAVSD